MSQYAGLPLWLVAILLLVSALGGGGVIGGIYTAKSSRKANREQRQDEMTADDHARAEVWNAGYRAAAEKHLQWDAAILAILTDGQREINVLRRKLGMDEHTFPSLPDKPPLFPEFHQAKS